MWNLAGVGFPSRFSSSSVTLVVFGVELTPEFTITVGGEILGGLDCGDMAVGIAKAIKLGPAQKIQSQVIDM